MKQHIEEFNKKRAKGFVIAVGGVFVLFILGLMSYYEMGSGLLLILFVTTYSILYLLYHAYLRFWNWVDRKKP